MGVLLQNMPLAGIERTAQHQLDAVRNAKGQSNKLDVVSLRVRAGAKLPQLGMSHVLKRCADSR